MQKIVYIIAVTIGLGWSISSCGSESEQSPVEVKNDSNQQENQAEPPTEIVQEEKQIKWYDGEVPTDADKLNLLSDFMSGKRDFDFYAVFTEPFWNFFFFGNQVLFHAADFEVPEVWPLEYPFTDDENEQALSFMRNGEFWQMKVTKEPGTDGMSNIEYPYSVKMDLFEGGGATSLVKEKDPY
ncbi:MAG: hypothetical protein NXI10_07695 [bacterium]|nr:hypothetical protein [bacterium]